MKMDIGAEIFQHQSLDVKQVRPDLRDIRAAMSSWRTVKKSDANRLSSMEWQISSIEFTGSVHRIHELLRQTHLLYTIYMDQL